MAARSLPTKIAIRAELLKAAKALEKRSRDMKTPAFQMGGLELAAKLLRIRASRV